MWKTHSFIGEPRYWRWKQQETRPSPLLGDLKHRPTQRKGESEGVWEWKRQGNLRGGMSVENPWSCQLMLVHPSPHPHNPDPAVTSPFLALSLRWEAAAFFRYFLTQDFTEHKLHHRQTGEILKQKPQPSQGTHSWVNVEKLCKASPPPPKKCFPYAWLWMEVYVAVSLSVIEKLWLCCFEKHFRIRTSSYINDTALSIISIHFPVERKS